MFHHHGYFISRLIFLILNRVKIFPTSYVTEFVKSIVDEIDIVTTVKEMLCGDLPLFQEVSVFTNVLSHPPCHAVRYIFST